MQNFDNASPDRAPGAPLNKPNGLGARWAMVAAAAGLVAAGAIGGGLMARQVVKAETAAVTDAPAAQVAPARSEAPKPQARPVAPNSSRICASCGVVESVRAERREGEATGVGAVAGGVIGGLIGNQMGGGDGKKAMTVVGAVGGGMAGNEIEKRQRGHTVYVTRIRMEDGSLRTLTRSSELAAGTRVRVEGQSVTLRD